VSRPPYPVPKIRIVEPKYVIFTSAPEASNEILRPMQSAAIAAGIEGRDCLTVLPTGGGKSCATRSRRWSPGGRRW
jgi:superfamily II DNA or RNA helicase